MFAVCLVISEARDLRLVISLVSVEIIEFWVSVVSVVIKNTLE